ncbi:hypothetical protein KAT80_01215 [Candidatus Pacearchaeota archaeon]|nr:hypothetical protein [Candidatus Pacearchaeota archaeon]
MEKRKAQVTIFIIIAIVIVGGAVVFYSFRDSIVGEKIPVSVEPVYNNFLSCLEGKVLTGIDILESQAGWISLPDFEPGSRYMPFSSQLNFLGNPVPYWYYVSGNNIQKEQVPSKKEMEKQLEDFIEEKINKCVFDEYYEQGFEINQGLAEARVSIREERVDVSLEMEMSFEKGEDSFVVKNHELEVDSKLGMLYDSAIEIYEKEQKDLFLENYAVDSLRLYAPVDGVELTCSPLTWNADEIFDELQEAIEANTLALKTKGGDYSLRKEENKYFVADVSVDGDVRFVNSKNWPSSFEVVPSDGSVLISKPVGNQPGLGILGFCYVPYHFVYNVRYPVLIQIQEGKEIFQFPVAVVIQGNKPRKALSVSAVEIGVPELCKYKNTLVDVNVYDTKLNSVEAEISYDCLGVICDIGETESGSLAGEFPQCVNGYVRAKAEGFEEGKYLYSTTETGGVDIILDKLYKLDVNLNKGGNAIISFVSDEVSKTIVYPEQKSVELSEGQYEISVYVYKNSSLKLVETTHEQCVEVPQSGLGGLFGLTRKECFEVKMPAQIISNALSGGGKENYYILESELAGANVIEINAASLPTPKSIEELQNNYILFEDMGLDVRFK